MMRLFKRLTLLTCLLLWASSVCAKPQDQFIQKFYHWLNGVNVTKLLASDPSLQQFFSKDIHLYHNGVKVADNRNDFVKHSNLVNHFIDDIHVNFPLQDVVETDNKIVVRHTLMMKKRGKEPETHQVISIFALKDGKIEQWWEVTKKIRPPKRMYRVLKKLI